MAKGIDDKPVRKPGQKAVTNEERNIRLYRSWLTIMLLAQADRPLTVEELHTRIHQHSDFQDQQYEVATIREDLKAMIKAGFPISALNAHDEEVDLAEGGRGKFKNIRYALQQPSRLGNLRDGIVHPVPSAADLLTLSVARDLLHYTYIDGIRLMRYARRFLDELVVGLNRHIMVSGQEAVQRMVHFGTEARLQVDPKRLEEIVGAIQKNRMIEGTYCKADGEQIKIKVFPCAIYFDLGRAYIVTIGTRDDVVRSLRFDRFVDFKVLAKSLKPKSIPDAELQRRLRSTFHGYQGEPVELVFEVSQEAAHLFDEFSYHASQQVEKRPDGTALVRLSVPLSWGVEQWLLGFGEFVMVRKPMELADRLRERMEKALARHGAKKG